MKRQNTCCGATDWDVTDLFFKIYFNLKSHTTADLYGMEHGVVLPFYTLQAP